jgi:AraC family transcriptional activator FtrA
VPSVPEVSLAPLLDWARQRLHGPLGVAELADRAAVSPATLHRRFHAELGTTPLAWLTVQRVDLACRMLEAGERRLDVVARTSGLGTTANLRAQLRRHTGLNPSVYRSRFGAGGVPPGSAPSR